MEDNNQYLEEFDKLIQAAKKTDGLSGMDFSVRGSVKEKFLELTFYNSLYEGYVLLNDEAVQMLTLDIEDKLSGKNFIWADAVHRYPLEHVKYFFDTLLIRLKQQRVKEFFEELKEFGQRIGN